MAKAPVRPAIRSFVHLRVPFADQDDQSLSSKLVADERLTDRRVDMNSNSLHAPAPSVCPVCWGDILMGQFVRRRVTGLYQHEACPGG